MNAMEEKSNIGDDLPYFPEKYPGKVCCLCNLSERSALGQGDLINLEVACDSIATTSETQDEKEAPDNVKKSDALEQNANRRSKISLKNKAVTTSDCTYELDKVGHNENLSLNALQDCGTIYIHRMCAMWSFRKNQIDETEPTHSALVLANALNRKCSFCGQYGASITCKMNCTQIFHLPCASASGCFLVLESFSIFCVEHLSQVHLLCNDNNIECQQCSTMGDLSKLIMCCTCGDHFHSTCIGLANLPDTRSGWNCTRCSKCQICRQQDTNEGRYVKCEQCQKIYHATCLRPVISSIPKYGWKCNRCRICTDCGSRTPGAGTSSRWHCHYTICDSCYQQRNKGFSCPMCQKAYRAAAYKEMVKCSWCNRFVHSTCDDEADLSIYYKKKENNPDYDYVCPQCKLNSSSIDQQSIDEINNLTAVSAQSGDISSKDTDLDCFDKTAPEFFSATTTEDQNKINNKKRFGLSNFRGKSGKIVLPRTGLLSQLNKKRSTRGKSRQLMLMGTSTGSSDRFSNRSIDADYSSDKKMLLCSARDKFILSQDICVMCGSLGIESDACLITCAQCGQCYHPYCVSVKPSKVMMQKGWRCLDCTVCEGCGKKNDEARLLLCDECDISYHIYCVSPPLEAVPQGIWKCQLCAACQKCGRSSLEKSAFSETNPLECLPCASQSACLQCNKAYKDNEVIIQCNHCERWSHYKCDPINNDRRSEYYDAFEYQCIQCRSKCKKSTPSQNEKKVVEDSSSSSQPSHNVESKSGTDRLSNLTSEHNESSEIIHWMDGVCVSEHGCNVIKSLATEIKRKRKLRQPCAVPNKDSGILAAIESVVSGTMLDPSMDEGGTSDKLAADKYKDGMVWEGVDATPPEGFSIITNDDGINILRKKRQRNLQKLGIGGFSVRNRALKKDKDEDNGGIDGMNSLAFNMEKKKKIVRKKHKNKLSEAYPPYLQEAFFGKTLLDSEETPIYESESSDGLESSNIRIHFNDSSQTNDVAKPQTTPVDTSELRKKIKTENPQLENKETYSKQILLEARTTTKPVVKMAIYSGAHQPSDIIKQEINIQTTVNEAHNDVDANNRIVMDRKANATFSNLYSKNPTNMLSSNELEKNSLNGYISTTTSVQTQKSTVVQDLQSPQHQMKACYLPVNQTTLNQTQPMQQQQQQQQQTMDNTMNGNTFKQHVMPQQMNLQNERTMVPQQLKSNDQSLEGIIAGTQKTAEKMRRDEDLGTMATISAVLYANTNHPDLKQLYPNWNDRCKQILKRWRSLSTEKKAPFLQHAKDNRSALRMRRAQQDQDKTSFQQKSLINEEQERVWKQHQTKVKEEQLNVFSNFSGIPYDGNYANKFKPVGERTTTATHFSTEKYSNEAHMHKTLIRANSGPPNLTIKSTMQDSCMGMDTAYASEDIGNKKLRDLLQKQNSVHGLLSDNVGPFSHSDAYKVSLAPSHPMNQQRQLNQLSMGDDKNRLTVVRQSLHMVETQDNKSRLDMKMNENSEVVTVASELDKLESEENVGFGDILGGLGEGDDDDLLKSLTSEIGDAFNILEYADPELDALATSQSVLNTLDFEDNEKNT